jgi:NAD(P)-dependent dehydrogenase (short-subunit alcohol dehydrogenase family)
MNPVKFNAEPNSFAGRVILITGATSGIGRSLALGLAQLGATVLLLGRDVAALEALFDKIKDSHHPEPGIVPFDLSQDDPERLSTLKQVITERYGVLDGLIHNAAILGDRVPFEHYNMTTWAQVFRTNFETPVALTQALLPLLQQSSGGALIFTSSSVGYSPKAYWGAYAASKYALEGVASLLSEELENTSDIRVSVVNPGATRTKMRQAAYPSEDPASVKPPEDLLALFTYLLSATSGAPRGHRFQSNGNHQPLVRRTND